jgi:hypothetical protein
VAKCDASQRRRSHADANAFPDCLEDIPTVSARGLVILTLLLLTMWKLRFGGEWNVMVDRLNATIYRNELSPRLGIRGRWRLGLIATSARATATRLSAEHLEMR